MPKIKNWSKDTEEGYHRGKDGYAVKKGYETWFNDKNNLRVTVYKEPNSFMKWCFVVTNNKGEETERKNFHYKAMSYAREWMKNYSRDVGKLRESVSLVSEDLVEDVLKDSIGSATSGKKLGKKPSKSEIREEVRKLKKQGMDGKKIGKRIGVFYMARDDTETLDKLEEVLMEEFENYGD